MWSKMISRSVDYGRLMHPLESAKFTDGELNNAMGSDFYQRDHGVKLRKESKGKDIDESINSEEGNTR